MSTDDVSTEKPPTEHGDAEWPLRDRYGWPPVTAMGELLRYSHDPDQLAGADVARWAYDTIRELSGMVRALSHPTIPVETTTTTTTVTVDDAELSPRALALLIRMAREFDTDDSHSHAETVMAQLLPLPDDVEPELLRVAIAHASAVLDIIDPE